jgi:hypothetical protein
MKSFLVFSILVLTACGRVYNSNFADDLRFGGNVTGSADFFQARSVMATRCFICHSEWATFNETDFEPNFLVDGGNLADSILYTRIRGNVVESGGDMPPSETLSSEEINKIKTWIMGL